MTADDLMRLVNRYTEACDDLGAGLFNRASRTISPASQPGPRSGFGTRAPSGR